MDLPRLSIFAMKDGQPHVIVSSKRLPPTKSAAAFDPVRLEMAGRQLSEVDDDTEAEVLRTTVKRYGKVDQSNFSGTMKMLGSLVLTGGKGANVKRTQPGIEAAADLVKAYAAPE